MHYSTFVQKNVSLFLPEFLQSTYTTMCETTNKYLVKLVGYTFWFVEVSVYKCCPVHTNSQFNIMQPHLRLRWGINFSCVWLDSIICVTLIRVTWPIRIRVHARQQALQYYTLWYVLFHTNRHCNITPPCLSKCDVHIHECVTYECKHEYAISHMNPL